MVCPRCNTENSEGARFCSGCGSPNLQSCSRCGVRLPAGARFCEACGTPAGAPAVRLEDKRSDPVATPVAAKDPQTPLPAADFRQATPQSGPETSPAEPFQAVSIMAPWQWGVAIAGGAVFLFSASTALVYTYLTNWMLRLDVSPRDLNHIARPR